MEIIDITKQLETKKRLESSDETLTLIADLIKNGDVKEVIGIIKYNEIYYSIFENIQGVGNNLKPKEFKELIVKYIDKVPTQKIGGK